MIDFKIGQRVRCGNRSGVVVEDDGGYRWPLRVEEGNGREFWISRDGKESSLLYGRAVERAEPANGELAELRAFKEAAIARFPVLADPETDEQAAQKFAKEWRYDDIETVEEVARAAIAWARANP